MKRTDIRKIFTGRKKALAGCLAAVIVLAGGFNVWQSSQVPEFPNFTDPVVETTITEDDTPLASKPKVTTKTTSNTKTTRKKVKLKKAATKTYTKKLGFTVTIDPSVNYGGCFNAHSRSIILRFENETIYHELGHFLAFVAGNVDRTSDFAAVYNSEKSKFTGINRSYATQNSSEYFAESVLEYVTSPSTLKRQRPKTYAAIVAALNKITDERIQRVMDIYGPFWS